MAKQFISGYNELDCLRGIAHKLGGNASTKNELGALRTIVTRLSAVPGNRTVGNMNEIDCLRAIVRYYAQPDVILPTLVFIGDSLTEGLAVGVPDNYPSQTMALLGASEWNWFNMGLSGTTTQGHMGNMAALQAKYGGAGETSIAVYWGGTNDLFYGEAAAYDGTVAGVSNRIRKNCQILRDYGFRVICLTILPRSDASIAPTSAANRLGVNTNLKVSPSDFCDALVRVDENSTIGDPGDETNPVYYTDLCHLTPAGYAIVAGLVAPAIETVLAMGPMIVPISEVARWQANVAAIQGAASGGTVAALNAFRDGCIADDVWGDLVDVHMMCGDFAASLVRLKYSHSNAAVGPYLYYPAGVLTGDYVETGATGGFQGNGSKVINVQYSPTNLGFSAQSGGFTVYINRRVAGSYQAVVGTVGGSASRLYMTDAGFRYIGNPINPAAVELNIFTAVLGSVSMSYVGGTLSIYNNGSVVASNTPANQTINSETSNILGEWQGGLQAFISHRGLNATKTLALHNRLLTFETTLTRN